MKRFVLLFSVTLALLLPVIGVSRTPAKAPGCQSYCLQQAQEFVQECYAYYEDATLCTQASWIVFCGCMSQCSPDGPGPYCQ